MQTSQYYYGNMNLSLPVLYPWKGGGEGWGGGEGGGLLVDVTYNYTYVRIFRPGVER